MAISATSAASDEFGKRWRGNWIWLPGDPRAFGDPFGSDAFAPQPERHAQFRKTFTLERTPKRALARLTADSRYVLYVNGVDVSRGPIRSQPRRLRYDQIDIAPWLRAGENVIAAHVRYFGSPKSSWLPAAANGSLGRTGVFVFEAKVGNAWLISDDSWRALPGALWLSDWHDAGANLVGAGVPGESVDARLQSPGWQAAGFDDSAWAQAHIIRAMSIGSYGHSTPPSDPYGPLLPNTLAALGGETQRAVRASIDQSATPPDARLGNSSARAEAAALANPPPADMPGITLPLTVAVPATGHTRVVLDFGRVVTGLVSLRVRAAAGTIFDLGYFETPVRGPSPFGAHGGTRYVARGADDAHTFFDGKGFRYIHVLVHGAAAGEATLEDITVNEQVYPWKPGASFACSDPAVTRLYQAGIRTVRLNSWDAFIDCPTREQRAWVGDAVVHQMTHLTANTDWRLAWHYLDLCNSPRADGMLPMSVAGDIEYNNATTIPDWALHWIHGVHNLYRFTGDRERVKELMPTIERVLRWFTPYLRPDGLLENVIEWNLIDWSSIFTEGCSGIINAGWARGLSEFAEMAGWLGERASQRWAKALYAGVKAGFDVFWDEARGVYIDHIKDGMPQRPVNQIGGALAILSGLAPRKRWTRIADVMTDPAKLVVRSFVQPPEGTVPPEEMGARFGMLMNGGWQPDWDVENQIVIAEPFMSYAVHDAVALAGQADRLPSLIRRWDAFFTDGYDTFGENWGAGTHVHGWSSTPTKDLVFYTLGVTPDVPGYTRARIAPRLGALKWARGAVPTPHGLIKIDINATRIKLNTPVPCLLDLPGRKPRALKAGAHVLTL